MGRAVYFVLVAVSVMVCLTPSVRAGDAATPKTQAASPADLQISTDVTWKIGMLFDPGISNTEPAANVEVSLIVQGSAAATATACGDIKVDSIKDENGQHVKAELRGSEEMLLVRARGMLLVHQNCCFVEDPKDSVRVSFGLYDPPPLKLSELRGSFALRTGGHLQVVIPKDALKQTGRVIEDATLKSLGVTVHMTRTTRQPPTENETKLPAFSLTGEVDDAQDELEFDVNNGEKTAVGGYNYPAQHAPREYKLAQKELKSDVKTGDRNAVVRLEITDANGKLFVPIKSTVGFGSSISKAEFSFKDRLPDDSQLRLTIHRDAQEIRVPFALKDIEIPQKKEPNGNKPIIRGSIREHH